MLLSVSGELRGQITLEIEAFRQWIWDMVEKDTHAPTEVMQLNVQYIPRFVEGDSKRRLQENRGVNVRRN